MNKPLVDCLVIGYNEMDFVDYVKKMERMGMDSSAYRYFNLNFILYNDKPLTLPDIFNKLYEENLSIGEAIGKFSQGNFFSNTIAYLGTYLHRRGITFDFVNSFQDEKEKLKNKLLNNNILTIAITTTLYVSYFPIAEIIGFIREHNITAKIIVGGPFISAQIRSLDSFSLNYLLKLLNADFYINSPQGEATLVDIIQALKKENRYENINNIFYKDEKTYIATTIVPEDNKLNENYVDWRLFGDRLGQFALIRTAISCPYSCAYCEYPQHAGMYQTMNVDMVQKELDSINSIGTVKSINFIDDTFNIPLERFKDVLKMIIKNKYDFKWNSFLRCQFLDEETVELMKESGCEAVYLGIESGNDDMLKNMNKTATVDKYKLGLELLKKNNIITIASFLVGFPGETEKTVNDTLRFIQENQPDFIRIHLWYCSVLTPIWNKKDIFNITGSQYEWSHKTMNSHIACDMIDYLIQNLKGSVYIPQHSFDSIGVMNLLHRGFKLEQVKNFIQVFNESIIQRINDPSKTNNINDCLINKMKLAVTT
jgi:anaerobic magnesium-protoporphyrin IX monomethyl ester cyclase